MPHDFKYIKIPREIIYGADEKRVLLFSYLCSRRSFDGTVAFSIAELCHWSHVSPNHREGKINSKYIDTLIVIADSGYFTSYPDFSKLANRKNENDYCKVALNTEKFDKAESYGIIYLHELQSILNFKELLQGTDIELIRMSSAYILTLLAYIRVNMNYADGKPLCCYRFIKTISTDTEISEKYIKRAITILQALDIIACKEIGKWKRNESYHTAPHFFANKQRIITDFTGKTSIDKFYDCNNELDKQIEIYMKGINNYK